MYTEKQPYLICSYAAMAADIGVYIFYAVKTSSKGVMDNNIAENSESSLLWEHRWYMVFSCLDGSGFSITTLDLKD